MHRAMRNSTLRIIENVGHCPHLERAGRQYPRNGRVPSATGPLTMAGPPDHLSAWPELLEHAPCGLLVTEPDGIIRLANATFYA